jgi:ABC-2 type transport system ATP-binding protein
MQQLKERGTTIFLNSHLLGEVELICDRVGILNKGEMIREGDVATLTRVQGSFMLGLATGQDPPREELLQKGYQVLPRGDLWEVMLSDGQSIDQVIDLLRSKGLGLRHLVEKRQSLEELFIETVVPVELEDGAPVRGPRPFPERMR